MPGLDELLALVVPAVCLEYNLFTQDMIIY